MPKMADPKQERLRQAIAEHLEEVSCLFRAPVKLALTARFPGVDEGDVLVSDDSSAEIIALVRRRAAAAGEALPPTENEKVLAAALERMLTMHDAMFKQTNVGASFFGGETLQEMNEAPIQARQALAEYWKSLGKESSSGN